MTTAITYNDCRQLLKRIRVSQENLISYELNRLGETPLGFLGEHRELVLIVKHETNGHRSKRLSFFVKAMPSIKEHSEYIDEIGAFRKEMLLYKNLMSELQNVSEKLGRQWSPKCYLIKDDALVFENLLLKNYRITSGAPLLDLDHCVAVVKTLADLHTSSILWENENQKKINEAYPDVIKEATYVLEEPHTRSKWLTSGINALIYICNRNKLDCSNLSDKIRKAVSDVGPSEHSCNVLCHGDLWSNNFMFGYYKDKVEKCIIVDYQLVRYAPCALDLTCCLYLITSQATRRQHLSQLINVYYEHFVASLKRCGLDPEKIICGTKLLEECEKYKIAALSEACLYGLNIWLPDNITSDALSTPTKCRNIVLGDRTPIVQRAYDEDQFFRSHMTVLLKELIEA